MKDTLYQMLGKVEEDIIQSYTGGAVDVYITNNFKDHVFKNTEREKLYYYDVNSLYPYLMSTMPIGKPIAFDGDIRSVISDAYGFFYCKIATPEYLEHPILQRRIKTSDGIRTVAGLATWEGWINSMEMDNAIKYGYTFTILKGYRFKKAIIFKDYVEKLYNLRLTFSKDNPMNLIAKLLMNYLYGKFGMKPESTTVRIYDSSSEEDMASFNAHMEVYGETVQDHIKVDKYIIVVRNGIPTYRVKEDEDLYHGVDVSIAVAAAITSGARILMSEFKNQPDFDLYYTDTDSIITNNPLPSDLVGNQLGQFKLEYEINDAVFLAPKVYGFTTTSGQ